MPDRVNETADRTNDHSPRNLRGTVTDEVPATTAATMATLVPHRLASPVYSIKEGEPGIRTVLVDEWKIATVTTPWPGVLHVFVGNRST